MARIQATIDDAKFKKDMHGNQDPRKTLRSEQERLKETREENRVSVTDSDAAVV